MIVLTFTLHLAFSMNYSSNKHFIKCNKKLNAAAVANCATFHAVQQQLRPKEA